MPGPLQDAFASAFVVSVLLAVFGNAAVYVLLTRRRVPVRFIWAGTPGYLYRLCVRAVPPVPKLVRLLAFWSTIAFLLAFLFAALAFGTTTSPYV